MQKTHSYHSFFRYTPKYPLINSYKRFLDYIKYNNLKLSNESKKKAFFIYLNFNRHIPNDIKYKNFLKI
jgi:hypothetical protein